MPLTYTHTPSHNPPLQVHTSTCPPTPLTHTHPPSPTPGPPPKVCERTAADKKGGHLARRKADGKYMLRESAMCPDGDKAAFEDITLHKYFNTNNLWVNLPLLKVGGWVGVNGWMGGCRRQIGGHEWQQ